MKDIEKIKKLVSKADYILIGAGAGLSTAAGNTYSGERFTKNFKPFIEKYILQIYIHPAFTLLKLKKKDGLIGQNIFILPM